MNSLVIASLALMGAYQSASDEPAVILVRDGGRAMTDIERRLLQNPTADDLRQIETDGYLSVQLEGAAVLIIDPLAPPIGEMFQTRVLLEAIADIGNPKRIGDLSDDSKRVIESLATRFGQPLDLSADTTIAVGASATFEFRYGESTMTRAIPLESGKHKRFETMDALTKAPARAKSNPPKDDGISPKDRWSSCEILLSESWKRSPRGVDLFKRATDELNRIANEERRKRDAIVNSIVASLLEANPNLPGVPNDSWSKDMIPESMSRTIEDNFRNSWKALGFDSADSAAKAFTNSSLVGAGIRFELSFGVSGMQSTVPVVGSIVFGNTVR